MSWTLCSKADVISIHCITEAALPDLWSDAVEQLIREHLSKPGLGLAQVEVTESYSGDGTPVLILRQLPIISISSLSIDEEDISTSDYVINKTSLQLTGERVFTEGNLNVFVTYLSGGGVDENGLITDPLIRLAAAAMVVAIANYKGRAGANSSLKWGNAEQKEGNSTPNFDIGLTSHLRKIMKNMLRRSRLRIK